MNDQDPLVSTLTSTLIDVVWWLETCDDDEVDPDSAVKTMENVAATLADLPPAHHERLLETLATLADREPDPERREFLESFPSDFGLVDDGED
ncbi:hypothetical protein ABZ714_01865 [Streptomyces sp. NPDC006798]|uniref:hypothetical protein n=1 Tax=Streptomyces sp. NPDC006798 TaxID=3155462 RepID=UPI0033EB76C9